MKRMSVILKSFYRLKGYCEKQISCDSCKFLQKDGCVFASGIPANWELPEKETEPDNG